MPIADLRKAFSLNDRLLFTRTLFGGDANAFEHTLQMVNDIGSFELAKNWLVEHAVQRFGWGDKSVQEEAKRFIQLVRRRYK